MSGSLNLCDIPEDVKKQIKDFRFQKSNDMNAIILKINRTNRSMFVDQHLLDCTAEDLRDELPIQEPRFIVLSYVIRHADGRVSYPMCLIFYSPAGSNTELQILYTGSRNHLVKECDLTKCAEVRDVEEITEEFFKSRFC